MQRNTKPEDYRLAQTIIDLGLLDYFSLQNRYEIFAVSEPFSAKIPTLQNKLQQLCSI